MHGTHMDACTACTWTDIHTYSTHTDTDIACTHGQTCNMHSTHVDNYTVYTRRHTHSMLKHGYTCTTCIQTYLRNTHMDACTVCTQTHTWTDTAYIQSTHMCTHVPLPHTGTAHTYTHTESHHVPAYPTLTAHMYMGICTHSKGGCSHRLTACACQETQELLLGTVLALCSPAPERRTKRVGTRQALLMRGQHHAAGSCVQAGRSPMQGHGDPVSTQYLS